ncbi:MAG: Hemolysin secretion protein D, chromosomal [Betaproteobacteria bacterium ADurb.Bin341]|nr:MAG: Hemolysin secretion protein D, chromosomal [Betaproteobacteria bacterium ADurb.Bin341]
MSIRLRLAAYTDLLRRYKAVFLHYWQRRHELSGKILLEHEAEYLSPALALQAKPVSPASRVLAKVLIALIFVLLTWSILGKMDIVVNAKGRIIPSGYSKTIASVDTASVRALYVEEGKQVKAGDVLIELDTSASDAEREKALGDHNTAILQAARAQALISAIENGTPPRLPAIPGIPPEKLQIEQSHVEGEYRDFVAKKNRIEGDISRYSKALALAAQRSRDYAELAKNRDVSHHAWMEKEQARVDLAGLLANAQNQRNALITETTKVAQDQITEGNKIAAATRQDAIRSDARSKLLKLTAPVDGTVQQLDVHTVGGVVAATKPLMQIVPKGNQVEVEAFLENKDVGFVVEGQRAEVKIDAFEYTKYGTITGKISHVSRDAIADEKRGLIYSTKIALDRSKIAVEGREVLLSAGMSVNVEIKTGERRIIEYVLSPLLQHKRESLNER